MMSGIKNEVEVKEYRKALKLVGTSLLSLTLRVSTILSLKFEVFQ